MSIRFQSWVSFDVRLVVVQRDAVLAKHGDLDLAGGLEVLGLDGRRNVVVAERLYRERLAGPAVAVLRIVQPDVLHPQRGAAFGLDRRVNEVILPG